MPQKLNLVTALKSAIYQALPLCQAEPQAALYFYIYCFPVLEMSASHRQQRLSSKGFWNPHWVMELVPRKAIKTGVKPQVCLTVKPLLLWQLLGI